MRPALAPLLAAAVLAAIVGFGPRATAAPPTVGGVRDTLGANSGGFLSQCGLFGQDRAKRRCYVRALLAHVERSRDPANEVPRIDVKVREAGGFLAWNCHMLMHEVGRLYARKNGVTLTNLQRYVPRSNDPNCSGGFGMGLVIHLGPTIVNASRQAVRACLRLPTRFRRYTCIHGLGHAFMRGRHGYLPASVAACRALGPRYGPDCAQGVFHDYWFSLRGTDGTTRGTGAGVSPRSVCNGHLTYVRPCWYRYFLDQPAAGRIDSTGDILRLCRGLRGLQREGCVAAASLRVSTAADAVEQTRVCARLPVGDVDGCLRGVLVPSVAGDPRAQLELVRSCEAIAPAARDACYEWFGRTLAVVTNGKFETTGCTKLRTARARSRCVSGARAMERPLVTFS